MSTSCRPVQAHGHNTKAARRLLASREHRKGGSERQFVSARVSSAQPLRRRSIVTKRAGAKLVRRGLGVPFFAPHEPIFPMRSPP